MKLSDLMDINELELELQNGYVRERRHPLDANLVILNYGEAREYEHTVPLFQMLDGRDISPWIWKTLKPKGETPSLLNRSEDVS